MFDGSWTEGKTKDDMSCIKRGSAGEVLSGEQDLIRNSIEIAKKADEENNLI